MAIILKLNNGYDIEMYTADNERKSIVAERIIGILKNKISKYMTSISKSVYNGK